MNTQSALNGKNVAQMKRPTRIHLRCSAMQQQLQLELMLNYEYLEALDNQISKEDEEMKEFADGFNEVKNEKDDTELPPQTMVGKEGLRNLMDIRVMSRAKLPFGPLQICVFNMEARCASRCGSYGLLKILPRRISAISEAEY
ncbi:hypothetical protein Tcan_09008 [Toxocara canis]|uniref:Uncharacterized protein n=1 Tax=Toxocara canis TaxID=6265 RepID=A0A0B2VFC4_TOXCA|nr:hypothetical protein Tcan_09008 [Toxocara canis]